MIPDRAEQQIFAALPQLDAVPRRGLALALAGVPRAGIASELGLSGAALSEQLARGRKALRRTRGHVGNCAKISGLSRRSITDKIAQYDIKKEDFKKE